MTYWSTCLDDSPVFLIKMEEASGTITDFVGGKTGTATGSPTYAQAGPTTGIPFSIAYPTGAYHSFTDHADLDLGDGPFTIECWFKRDTDASALDLFGKGSASDSTGYSTGITSTDRIGLRQGNNTQHRNTTADIINNTTWHYYAAVRAAATTAQIYVDGVEPTGTTVGAVTFTDNNLALLIGRRSVATASFIGNLAAFAIYKSALSSTRIAAHYAARNDLDNPFTRGRPRIYPPLLAQ